MGGARREKKGRAQRRVSSPQNKQHAAQPANNAATQRNDVPKKRYGEWRKILALAPPPPDARGVTAAGGRAFAEAAHRFARCLALAAKADAHTAAALGLGDRGAYDAAARAAAARHADAAREVALLRVRP